MKTTIHRLSSLIMLGLLFVGVRAFAQQPAIQYFRPYDQRGINVFETSKNDTVEYDGFKFRIGASFAQQFQSLKHENDYNTSGPNTNKLYDLTRGTNLAMANLNFDVQIADGVKLNLVSYMSSRHHNEFWVKGGYLQIDKVDFLNSTFFSNLWKNLTLKVGHMEVNYGDAHFYRSDGGNTLWNPFMDNNIMDAFTTEIGTELYWQKNGIIVMAAITDGEIQGSVTKKDDRKPSIYGKIGYDKQVSDNVRVRLTGSVYSTKSSISNTIFGGDRTGSHYYYVMEPVNATLTGNAFSGRFNPGFRDNVTTFVLNPFVKAGGFEFFGTYEVAQGNSSVENGEIQSTNQANPVLNKLDNRKVNQLAVQGLYRFANDKLYLGVKYNKVSGTMVFGSSTTQPNVSQGTRQDISIDRTSIAGGWFVTRNVLLKLERVSQKYNDYPTNNILSNGKFSGWLVEGVIGF